MSAYDCEVHFATPGAVELRNAVMAQFEVDLPATTTFDHPTVTALAAHINSKLSGRKQHFLNLPPVQGRTSSFTEIVGISSSVAASGAGDRGESSN